jgi:hypothetical protein
MKANERRWAYRTRRTHTYTILVGQFGEKRPLEAIGADGNIKFDLKEIVCRRFAC